MASTDNQQPLTTQGSDAEREGNLGGTTNLSLEQLKQEGDTNNPGEDDPNSREFVDDVVEDTDSSDTFDEPTPEDYASDEFDDLADEEDQERNDGEPIDNE